MNPASRPRPGRRWRPVGPALLLAGLLLTAPSCAQDQAGAPTGTAVEESVVNAPTTTVTKETAQLLLTERYGITHDAAQGGCLADAFVARPQLLKLLERGNPISGPEATELVDLLTRCMGSQTAAVHALVENSVTIENLTEEIGACLEPVMAAMSRDDLIRFTAGDKATLERFRPQLTACAPRTAGTTADGSSGGSGQAPPPS
jgi:hypothetical protein